MKTKLRWLCDWMVRELVRGFLEFFPHIPISISVCRDQTVSNPSRHLQTAEMTLESQKCSRHLTTVERQTTLRYLD